MLDSGSTINIISTNFLSKLSNVEARVLNTIINLADGKQVVSIAEVQNLNINIMGICHIISAIVLDHHHYDILLGESTIGLFKIYTNWEKKQWEIKVNNQKILLEVDAQDLDCEENSEDENKECFLVLEENKSTSHYSGLNPYQ